MRAPGSNSDLHATQALSTLVTKRRTADAMGPGIIDKERDLVRTVAGANGG
jgi:hypothetical protein